MGFRQLKGFVVSSHPVQHSRSDGDLLASAISVIANYWRLTDDVLGHALNIEPNVASQIRSGRAHLEPKSESLASAQLLLRLFQSLDGLFSGDDAAASSWLFARNVDLGARPVDCMEGETGLRIVCDYLDGAIART